MNRCFKHHWNAQLSKSIYNNSIIRNRNNSIIKNIFVSDTILKMGSNPTFDEIPGYLRPEPGNSY